MADQRWALVVGASRGLGLGLAAELKARDWNVVATVRDEAGERRLQELAAKPGGAIRVEHVDINDDAAVAAMRQRLDREVFDLVFVNAGIAPPEGHDAARLPRGGGKCISDQRGGAGASGPGVSRPGARRPRHRRLYELRPRQRRRQE